MGSYSNLCRAALHLSQMAGERHRLESVRVRIFCMKSYVRPAQGRTQVQRRRFYAGLAERALRRRCCRFPLDLGPAFRRRDARRTHPDLRLHLSVQASATNYEAIEFYRERYGIQRAVLPRVLTLSQVAHLIRHTSVEIEVFGFGSLCVMVEGRCALSSYATGQSPNNAGVCSPPSAVRWDQCGDRVDARLGGILIDQFEPNESRGYPTLCKGRFDVEGTVDYAIEEPTSLNTLAILPDLMRAGVSAIKIEGRQRSAAYVEQVTRTWRQAIDACRAQPERYTVQPAWTAALGRLAEGQQHTLGAFSRPWQ